MTLLDSLNVQHNRFRRTLTILWLGMILALFAPVTNADARTKHIVALGDSLTAGYGLAAGEAFPEKLEKALVANGFDVKITNAGVSGDTSTAGLQRLDWAVGDDADIVIVELGANDALRGIDPSQTRLAMEKIVSRLRARGKKVLLAGMLAPPNLGEDYGKRFAKIYKDLGAMDGVTLYPFFLDGVASHPELNQPDGLHPTAKGIDEIVRRFVPVIVPMLK